MQGAPHTFASLMIPAGVNAKALLMYMGHAGIQITPVRRAYRTRNADPISMMESTMPEPQQLHVNVRLEDGALWATVEEFPGVFATGDNLDELRESLREGIALVLARPGEEPPTVTLAPLRSEPVATTASSELVYA